MGTTLQLIDEDLRPVQTALGSQQLILQVTTDVEAEELVAVLRSYRGESAEIDLHPVEGYPGLYWSYSFKASEVLDLENGEVFSADVLGGSTGARFFERAIDAKKWHTRMEIAGFNARLIQAGSALTYARRVLIDEHEESSERDQLVRLIDRKLERIRSDQVKLGWAMETLDNPKLYEPQQVALAKGHLTEAKDPDARVNFTALKEHALKEVIDGMTDGYVDITIGGYEMLAGYSGAGPMYTLSMGEDVKGNKVGWGDRATAFVDLVANGMLTGIGIKGHVDDLMAASKPRTAVGPKLAGKRYIGPKPEANAPSGSVLDPADFGMPESSIRALSEHARRHDHVVLVRPTTTDAPALLDAGALPKPEFLKSKTVSEIDTLLGMDPAHRGKVGLFDPSTDYFETALRSSGIDEATVRTRLSALRDGTHIEAPPGFGDNPLWDTAVKRFHQRRNEFTGAIGVDTHKHVTGGKIRIEDGVIVDAATGKPYTGDHDLFEFLTRQGVPIDEAKYLASVEELKGLTYVEHGAHSRWNPQRSDFPEGAFGDAKYAEARKIYESIIAKHQAEEILIAFTPEGIPVAVFANEKVRPFGFAAGVEGSAASIPRQVIWASQQIERAITQPITYDEDSQAYLEADAEFRAGGSAEEGASPPRDTRFPAMSTTSLIGALIGVLLVVGLGTFLVLGSDTPVSDGETLSTVTTEPVASTQTTEPVVTTVVTEPVVENFEATIGPSRFVVTVPSETATGSQMSFTVCSYDADGTPREGAAGFFTIGLDPAGPQASHASGTLASDGCFSDSVEVREPAGTTDVLTSDGAEAVVVGQITITPTP